MQEHSRIPAAARQQGLNYCVRQLPLAHRQPVPTGPMCGQAGQNVRRSGRVPPQPGQLRLLEMDHAYTLAEPQLAGRQSQGLEVRDQICAAPDGSATFTMPWPGHGLPSCSGLTLV